MLFPSAIRWGYATTASGLSDCTTTDDEGSGETAAHGILRSQVFFVGARKWDVVTLVLVDEAFKPVAMYEIESAVLKKVINKPGGGKARKNGALAITQFISAGRKVWSR